MVLSRCTCKMRCLSSSEGGRQRLATLSPTSFYFALSVKMRSKSTLSNLNTTTNKARHRIGRYRLPREITVPKREALYSLKKSTFLSPPDLRLTMLGTGSQVPTKNRNPSATALHIQGKTWLFDCGEGTHFQLLQSTIAPSTISRIFITHLHGDHFFGLPSVLCSLNTAKKCYHKSPIEVFGPPGLRVYLRTVLKTGRVHLRFLYKVHELHPSRYSVNETDIIEKFEGNGKHPQEVQGKNILPGPDGIWSDLPSSNTDVDTFSVHAVNLRHTRSLPSIGFVLKETDYLGKANPLNVKERLENEKNKEFFRRNNWKNPYAKMFEQLKLGQTFELADGVIRPDDVYGPKKKGRKVVILGDTFDASSAASMAAGATLVVHEATNAFLPGHTKKHLTPQLLTARTISHGHSTPEMAGAFAQAVGASSLLLTHISPQYCGLESKNEKDISQAFVDLAKTEFDRQVEIAHDNMSIEIRGEWEHKNPRQLDLPYRVIVPRDCDEQGNDYGTLKIVSPEEAAIQAVKTTDRFIEFAREGFRNAN